MPGAHRRDQLRQRDAERVGDAVQRGDLRRDPIRFDLDDRLAMRLGRLGQPRHRTAERDYLAAAMELLAFRRDRHEHLTVDERIAVRAAYWLLDQGVHIPGELVAQEADAVPVQRLLDRIQEGEHAVRDADLALAYAEHRLEGLQGVEH